MSTRQAGTPMRRLRRREFITLLGGAAVAWPLAARAQRPAVPVVGYLDSRVAATSADQVVLFRRGLNQAGFIEGRNVAVEFRWAEGQLDRLPALAADLVRRQVTPPSSVTAFLYSRRSGPRPPRFRSFLSPVAIRSKPGYVASLNRPVGNITGVSFSHRGPR